MEANRCEVRPQYGIGAVKLIALDGINDNEITAENERKRSIGAQFLMFRELQEAGVSFILQSIDTSTETGKNAHRAVTDGLNEDRRECRDYQPYVHAHLVVNRIPESGYCPRFSCRALQRLRSFGSSTDQYNTENLKSALERACKFDPTKKSAIEWYNNVSHCFDTLQRADRSAAVESEILTLLVRNVYKHDQRMEISKKYNNDSFFVGRLGEFQKEQRTLFEASAALATPHIGAAAYTFAIFWKELYAIAGEYDFLNNTLKGSTSKPSTKTGGAASKDDPGRVSGINKNDPSGKVILHFSSGQTKHFSSLDAAFSDRQVGKKAKAYEKANTGASAHAAKGAPKGGGRGANKRPKGAGRGGAGAAGKGGRGDNSAVPDGDCRNCHHAGVHGVKFSQEHFKECPNSKANRSDASANANSSQTPVEQWNQGASMMQAAATEVAKSQQLNAAAAQMQMQSQPQQVQAPPGLGFIPSLNMGHAQAPTGFPNPFATQAQNWNPFNHIHRTILAADLPDLVSVDITSAVKSYTIKQHKRAVSMLSAQQGDRPDLGFILVDSGANHHIFNDAKWFSGFNDLQQTQLSVQTGGGNVHCGWKGTASFETIDNQGNRVLMICPDALLMEHSPFSILSQNAFQSKHKQGIASFHNPACLDPFMNVRCMKDRAWKKVDLHRADGLDWITTSNPGTLGGMSAVSITNNANVAKQDTLREALAKTTGASGGASSMVAQAFGSVSYEVLSEKPRVLLNVLQWPALVGYYTSIAFANGLHDSFFSGLTAAELCELRHVSAKPYSMPHQSDDYSLWSGTPTSATVDGFMGMHIRPDGIVSFHGWENPIVQAQHTMQDLHEMLGHIGQAKIEDYLKQVTDITVKGSRTLGQCDACSQAKTHRHPPPSSSTAITAEGPNICHIDAKFILKPSLQGATLCHDCIDHKTGLIKSFCVASKGDFLVVLQTVVQTMYAQYGNVLDIVHTDNAPEYGRGDKGDSDVVNFMLDHGMKPFSTEPYGHEQAGAQERVHRTLDEGMRANLISAGAPDAFWSLARYYYCETLNHIPNRRATELWRSMGNSGPCSAMGVLNGTGRVKGFWNRPFGCRCYVLPPGDQKLGALARRGIPGVFVGYASFMDSRGYVVYIPGRDRLLVTSNITLHRTEFPFKEGAITWNESTRQGEWAKDFTDPQLISTPLVQTDSQFETLATGARWLTDNDNPDLATDIRSKSDPKAKAKGNQKSGLSYKDQGRADGFVRVIKLTTTEIRALSGMNCEFRQECPKRKGSKSELRYNTYKHCTSVDQFIKEFPKMLADFANDYALGYVTVSGERKPATDSGGESGSDGEDTKSSQDEKMDSDSDNSVSETVPQSGTTTRSGRTTKLPERIFAARPRQLSRTWNVTVAAMAAAQTLLDSAVTNPTRSITQNANYIHGILIDSLDHTHDIFAEKHYDIMNAAQLHSSYTAGSIDPHSSYAMHVDLLNPHHTFDAEYKFDPYNLDYLCATHKVDVERFREDIYVLYADGDEASMRSMQDILTDIKTPWTIKEALNSPQAKEWMAALVQEMELLKQHGTYELIDKSAVPKGRNLISSKIAWRLKLDKEGKPSRYKARCTARGFTQTHGVDYKETFQPVARLESVRTFIAFAVACGFPMQQLDFEGAYLQGTADCVQYMSFPPELVTLGIIPEGKVALLKKSLYGLHQSGWVWWQTLSTSLRANGFKQCDAEPCCWTYNNNGVHIWIILHVDDGLVITDNNAVCSAVMKSVNDGNKSPIALKHTVNKEPADWYLGMKIDQEVVNGTLVSCTLSQNAYMKQACKANGVDINGKSSVHTPCTEIKLRKSDAPKIVTNDIAKQQEKYRSNVGIFLFLARCTLPAIAYAVGRLARFGSNSGPPHWKEMQHLVKYVKSVRNSGLKYTRPDPKDPLFINAATPTAIMSEWNRNKPHFRCYTDSDFAGCPDTNRSTSGNCIRWMGAAISWGSTLQACVTLSTAEAEMVALTKGAQDVIWLRRFISELCGSDIKVPSPIYCDNRATLALLENRQFHSRTKHIALRENFVRERTDTLELSPIFVPTLSNAADVFTKPCNQTVMDRHWHFLTGMSPTYV